MAAIWAVLPIVPPWETIAWVLLICWALTLVFGFVFGQLDEEQSNRIPRPIRMLSSGILVVCSLMWWLAPASSQLDDPHKFLFLGMLSSFVGDIAMSGLLKGKRQLWLGMAAFGAAHILYIVALLELRAVGQGGEPMCSVALQLAVTALALIAWWLVIRTPSQPLILNLASLAYCSLLISMSGLALGGAISDTRLRCAAIGSVLFVISDTLVGYRVVRGGRFRLIGDLIWMSYIIGQLLLVLSPAVAFGLA